MSAGDLPFFKELETEIRKRVKKDQPKTFKLLYRARNTNDLTEFHCKCDEQGPTVTVVHGRHNVYFGGYTSKDWTSATSCQTVEDNTAFLFYKKNNEQAEFNIFPIASGSEHRAITCYSKFGPTFGGGILTSYDLQTFDLGSKRNSEMKDTFLFLNGSHNFNCAYTSKSPHNKYDINGGTMEVKMLEVYRVEDNILPTSWRQKPENLQLDDMIKYLHSFEPLSFLEISCYNVLLVGVIGSGKSSLYNTLATALSGVVKDTAPTGEDAKSITNGMNEYELRSKANKPIHVKIIDIRGFEIERSYEHELEHLLNGRLPKNYQFPDKPVQSPPEKLLPPSFKNEIHLVCMVTDASKLDVQKDNDRMSSAFQAVKDTVRQKGIPLVAVATKFDCLCPRIRENADNVYDSPTAFDSVKAVAKYLGLQEKHVFPIVNYFNDKETQPGKDRLAIQALYGMVKLVQDYMEKDIGKKNDTWARRLTALVDKETNDLLFTSVRSELKLLEENHKELKVVCVGPVNSGKSSFIDSIHSSLTSKIKSNASGGVTRQAESAAVSASEKFQLYSLSYKSQKDAVLPAHVAIGDTPGVQAEGGIELEHVKKIIDGHVPNKFEIIKGITEKSKKYRKRPTKEDKIHCVCFVFDVTSFDTLSDKAKTVCRDLTNWLNSKGMPYIVIVTKVDEISKEESTLELFNNETVTDNMYKLMKTFRFRQQKVFPVRNYIHESDVVRDMDMLLLSAFQEILSLASEYYDKGEESSSGEDEDGSESHNEG